MFMYNIWSVQSTRGYAFYCMPCASANLMSINFFHILLLFHRETKRLIKAIDCRLRKLLKFPNLSRATVPFNFFFFLILFFCTKLDSAGRFEDQTKESNRVADQAECDIRDFGKKVHGFEIEFDETNDKLNKALESLEEKEKHLKEVEADIAALTRRIMLMEEEAKKSEQTLANTVTKLAVTSKVR
jgi:septal ring factor EnvC (AmiA/AmiB activator)